MKYNTNKNYKARFILIVLLLAIVAAGIGYLFGSANAEKKWDVCFDMPNQHIEWTYAGRK